MNEKWKELSEEIPVPDSLAPEQIEKMLLQKKNERRTHRTRKLANRIAVAAAACLLLLLALNILKSMALLPVIPDEPETKHSTISPAPEYNAEEPEKAAAGEAPETKQDATPHTTYAKLHKTISKYFRSSFTYKDKDGAIPESAEAKSAPGSVMADGAELYSEVSGAGSRTTGAAEDTSYTRTDLQVQGVDEGDIVKTDGTYIYSCSENAGGSIIHIYHADGKDTKQVSKITLEEISVREMYLDNGRLVAAGAYWGREKDDSDEDDPENDSAKKKYDDLYTGGTTCISVYDVSDTSSPKFLSKRTQSGEYYTSRKNGNYLYTLSTMYVNSAENSDDRKTYIPCADGELLPEDRLFLPEHVVSNAYLVLTALDVTNGDAFTDTLSVLGAGGICYVSEKHIYVATGFYDDTTKTTISKYRYQDGKLESLCERTFNGTLHNQFSMDEYDGNLRFVATTYHSGSSSTSTTNGLYVLDQNLKMTGSVDNLAKNERIYSARFLGTRAYFVTYRETDPVFFADLSDPEKPVIKDKLKIPGFSEYLHTFGDDLLLGIGRNQMKNGSMQVKFSMFDISTDTAVTEKHKKLLEKNTESLAGSDHKTVLVDTERNRIGLCIDNAQKGSSYRIYSYGERGFHEVAKLDPKGLDLSARGLFVGRFFYLVDDLYDTSGIRVYDADTFKRVK